MRLNLAGPAKGPRESVGVEMVAPLWPESASVETSAQQKEGGPRRSEQVTKIENRTKK
jgi:hypothetical protein